MINGIYCNKHCSFLWNSAFYRCNLCIPPRSGARNRFHPRHRPRNVDSGCLPADGRSAALITCLLRILSDGAQNRETVEEAAGAGIIVDLFGFHMGVRPKRTPRLMLEIGFGVSNVLARRFYGE
jgi:hypothetical protein